MELRLFILSLACLSCLMPPVHGSIHALKAAAVLGAVKGAALLKAAAIKGAVQDAADKDAALLAANRPEVKGALGLALKFHKLPAVRPPVIVQEPAVVVPVIVPANSVSVKTSPPRPPPASNSLSSLLSSAQQAAQHKIDFLSSALASLHQPRPAAVAAPVVVESFRYPYPARFYPAPLPVLHRIDDDCL